MNLLIVNMLKGWIVTLGGFVIVIVTLIILFSIFTYVSKTINYDWRKLFNKAKADAKAKAKNPKFATALEVNDDIAVAIGLALSLSSEVHDNEPNEITIERIQRRYSPWSSKIYGLNSLK